MKQFILDESSSESELSSDESIGNENASERDS